MMTYPPASDRHGPLPSNTAFYNLFASQVDEACSAACNAIAPAWPLDKAIAVNPHWQRTSLALRTVAARMAVLGGISVFPKREAHLRAWTAGDIRSDDLELALGQLSLQNKYSSEQCIDALKCTPHIEQLPLLIDVLDTDPLRYTRLSWRSAITHQVSQTCAGFFDHNQAAWQPERSRGLYDFWRETLQHDHGIGILMGIPDLERATPALPATAKDAERWALERFGLPQSIWADYLEAVLLTVNGWASWCAYLNWQASLDGKYDGNLRELLAIRLAWGALLLECKDDGSAQRAFDSLRQSWNRAPEVLELAAVSLQIDEVWQLASEISYQRDLATRLSTAAATPTAPCDIQVQAAFCIDVRSEPLRRALEAVWPGVQTMGFAGFFGLPVAYTPFATTARRPQLPGLLAPSIEATDTIVSTASNDLAGDGSRMHKATRARKDSLAFHEQWKLAARLPGSAFSYVETAGLGYLAKLGNWLVHPDRDRVRDDLTGVPARYKHLCRPALSGLDLSAKIELAARVLHAMGLEGYFAPLVVLVAHGSQSANNAHSAALECGACGGQTGEVNARTLAMLLNEPAVRSGLMGRGINIPPNTEFVAALHNTTTDEIEGFDLDLLPLTARVVWAKLARVFLHASDQTRRERAGTLGIDATSSHETLLRQFRQRANDGAQTRPEWGLAGNAAFLIAPRNKSVGAALGGRVFLHDYDSSRDRDGSVLELLMTAPMLVTHWINWQYHASTCEPVAMGSGNKLLHNVVGGNLGVFEGNGGDLRIGLSRQSLHDGVRWIHDPLRLTVVIDAPKSAIERVLEKHAAVRQLVTNGWLHLWRFEQDGFSRYAAQEWEPLNLDYKTQVSVL